MATASTSEVNAELLEKSDGVKVERAKKRGSYWSLF